MHVLVAGASGFVGTALLDALTAAGHTLTTLTRAAPSRPQQHRWDPATGALDPRLIDAADAVVNLAGAPIARMPWTPRYRREILHSRVHATTTLTRAMARAAAPPTVLVNASAVGFYGDRPGERLTEDSPRGEGFLADVVDRWERAAHGAPDGVRVVTARTGVVVGRGGAFGPLELLTRFGLAGRLGPGTQHWPWIALADEARALVHLVASDLAGPVNLEGPTPATASDATDALARAMHRWHPWVVPSALLRAALGGAAHELLLSDQRAVPERLLADGFVFEHSTIESAISATWGPSATV
ncbi:TIGR01777 family oxidoreductase [Galbitalea sp. SE-J8]|uniref:TIGR01777 family oxidoreductase n=1 Tax=Galbitalea sp. SE-J8 TaxID=3054952 RepID=UPI00259CF56A|nr:TIGR01777 family oxidoreductase [Galbitalea sp. SE-J8]MDM4762571.1 TIGR01777 family oxidoreductase [Galbitalea sp. SE-J8]